MSKEKIDINFKAFQLSQHKPNNRVSKSKLKTPVIFLPKTLIQV